MTRERSLEKMRNAFIEDLHARGRATRTRQEYGYLLRRFEAHLEEQGVDVVTEVTRGVLVDYQSHLLLAGGRGGQPLSASRRSVILACLKEFFRFLVRRGMLLTDPTAVLEGPRAWRRTARAVLTESEVKRLLLAPDVTQPLGLRTRTILELLYSTGIRASERCGLDTGDIDLASGELTVREGKGRRARRVPVGQEACSWVGRYLEMVRPGLVRQSSQRALILSWRGNRLSRGPLAVLVREEGERARIEKVVTPHVLRHSFATHLLKGQASVRHIQEMLGHVMLTTTQIYTHTQIDDLRETHRRCHPRSKRSKG